jgi:RNA recognition motif-containing protein
MSAVFISGFDWDTDEKVLSDHFKSVGAIKELYFQSKGAAVVTYEKAASANRAVSELHETTMKGQTRYCSVREDNPDREQSEGKGKGKDKGKSKGKGKGKGKGGGDGGGAGSAIYISGFEYETEETTLRKHFSGVGRIEDLYFQSNGSAVITYSSPHVAQRAVDELNETTIRGQSRYVAIHIDNRQVGKGKGKGKGKSGKGKGKGKGKSW